MVVDQLVVGHAALVHRRALLLELRLGTLLLGLLLRDARLLLGHLGAALALRRPRAMLAGDRLAADLQLALAPSCARAAARMRGSSTSSATSSSATTTMAMMSPVDMWILPSRWGSSP